MTIGKKVKSALKEEYFPAKPTTSLTQGKAIRILREKNGLSQNDLAELTGFTQSTISSLENGRINLGIDRAKILARALNTHPAVLAFPDWDSESVA